MTKLVTCALSGLLALAMLTPGVHAKEKKDGAGKPKKEQREKGAKADVQLMPVELVGTLTATDKTVKGKKDGAEKTIKVYALTGEDGKAMRLPRPRGKGGKHGAEAVDLSQYVDKKVTIKGQGYTRGKGDKARQFIKTIETVEVVAE